MKKPLVLLLGAAVMAGVALAGITIVQLQNWPSPLHSQAAIPEAAVEEPSDVARAPEAEAPPTMSDDAGPAAPDGHPPEAEDTLEERPGERENLAAVDPQEPGSDAAVQPSFDVVRIEGDGSLIAAGQAAPDAEVSLLLNGKQIGSVAADDFGEWLIIPADPLPPGNHQLTAEASDAAGSAVNSSKMVALAVPQREGQPQDAVLSDTSRPPEANDETGEQLAAVPDATPVDAEAEAGAPDDRPGERPAAEVAVAPQPELEPEAQAEQVPAEGAPLALESVDYDEDGDIVFSGRAGAGQTIRVYVDDTLLGEATTDGDGRWQFAGRDQITPGRHTLRADLMGATGDVLGRLLLPFVRAGSREVAALIESRRGVAETRETAGSAPEVKAPGPVEASPEPEAEVVAEQGVPVPGPETQMAAEDFAAEPEPAVLAEETAPKPDPEPAVVAEEAAPAFDPEAVVVAETTAPEPGPEAPVLGEETAPEPGPEAPVVAEEATPEPEGETLVLAEEAVREAEPLVVAQQAAPEPDPEAPAVAIAVPVEASEPPTVAIGGQMPTPETAPAARGHVVIQPGNNLWRISRVIYGRGIEYTAIYEANRDQIRDPDLIYPGQIFATPGVNPPSEIDPDWRSPLGSEELAGRNNPG